MKNLIVIMTLVLFLVSCAPAAPTAAPTQAPIAVEARRPTQAAAAMPTSAPAVRVPIATQLVEATRVVEKEGMHFAATATPAIEVPAPGEVNARRDHLSTFAIDVDTASYTEFRRYLQSGQLPPADTVRIEEFVNYFRQDYASPDGAAFALYADAAPALFADDAEIIVRFGVQGYRVPDSQRKPLALTFVVDVSGSMREQNRLGLVKRSLEMLVDRLHAEDRVAIVAYSTYAAVVLEPTPARNKSQILKSLAQLTPQQTTNLQAGLDLGYQLANGMFLEGANNRVILCSDGVANVGITNADGILSTVSDYARDGIYLNTFGVGMGDFNDSLLEQLADKGDGMYAYIDNEEEAQRLFVERLTSTMETIAKDAKIQIDFNTDVVASYRQIGYENRAIADSDFRNDSVDAGEIGAGHTVTALYAVRLVPGAEGRIATMQLRWQDPTSGQVHEINGNYNSWDVARNFQEASARFRLDVVVAETAEFLRGSPYVTTYSLWDLREYARQAANELSNDPDVVEFYQLFEQTLSLTGE